MSAQIENRAAPMRLCLRCGIAVASSPVCPECRGETLTTEEIRLAIVGSIDGMPECGGACGEKTRMSHTHRGPSIARALTTLGFSAETERDGAAWIARFPHLQDRGEITADMRAPHPAPAPTEGDALTRDALTIEDRALLRHFATWPECEHCVEAARKHIPAIKAAGRPPPALAPPDAPAASPAGVEPADAPAALEWEDIGGGPVGGPDEPLESHANVGQHEIRACVLNEDGTPFLHIVAHGGSLADGKALAARAVAALRSAGLITPSGKE